MTVRTLLILFGAATLTVAATVAHVVHRQHQLESVFQSTNAGSPITTIVSSLGKPWSTSKCGTVFGDDEPNGCETELLYANPVAPLLPEYWSFQYDNQGKLIGKYHYVSP
ncbi:MAG: hypothetical protein WBY53_03155 [Acidobacteriaceae bacterium]